MHFPVNIPVGSASIPVHLVCETLAYFIGYRYYSYLRRRTPNDIDSEKRLIIFVGAAFGAFIGSHLLGILERPNLIGGMTLTFFMGNKTIIGGFLGGLIGVELVKKAIGVTQSSGDLMVYPLILAMVIGRTGCFLAGLEDGTYGVATTLPWGINFGDGVYRHPTNLYEMIFWLVLWVGLRLLEERYTLADGARFKLLLSMYLLFRLLIEFIKPNYRIVAGLGAIQLASIAGLLYYYRVFVYPSKLIIKHA